MRSWLLFMVVLLVALFVSQTEAFVAEPAAVGPGDLVWVPAEEARADIARPPTTTLAHDVLCELNERAFSQSYIYRDMIESAVQGSRNAARRYDDEREVWHPQKCIQCNHRLLGAEPGHN